MQKLVRFNEFVSKSYNKIVLVKQTLSGIESRENFIELAPGRSPPSCIKKKQPKPSPPFSQANNKINFCSIDDKRLKEERLEIILPIDSWKMLLDTFIEEKHIT